MSSGAAPPSGEAVRVSVVMPVFNGAETIGQQLEALSRQDWDGAWEVVVADNGSVDRSVEIARSFVGRLPGLRIVDASARTGASFAYNQGASVARGDYLLFCDADDEVDTGWVRAMAAALATHEVVGGRCLQDRLNPAWLNSQRMLPQQDGLQEGLGPIALPHIGSGNLGVRREVFTRLGGFRDDLPVFGDTDLSWRLQRAGHALHFAPDAVVHVRLRSRLRDAWRQGRAYGAAEQQLLRAHGAVPAGGQLARQALLLLVSWPRVVLRLCGVRTRGDLHAWAWSSGWRIGRHRAWRADFRHCVAFPRSRVAVPPGG